MSSYFSKKRRSQMQTKMNTYRMESLNKFQPDRVEKIIKEVVNAHLNETTPYEPGWAKEISKEMTTEIRDKVRQLEFERYKLVCLVDIVQKSNLDMVSCASFLWNADHDRYAGFTFHNNQLVCAALCVYE
uniref:Tctex1 domain-containing protein 1 n=1 Tax=Cacopsylla melanoneura TaxID=428564 RepID=A0A8D9E5X3_9HEMI